MAARVNPSQDYSIDDIHDLDDHATRVSASELFIYFSHHSLQCGGEERGIPETNIREQTLSKIVSDVS